MRSRIQIEAGFSSIIDLREVVEMDQFVPIISEVGFPIVVTLYLLYRIETRLDMVVQSIQELPAKLKESL
jgi:YvrJ protein family